MFQTFSGTALSCFRHCCFTLEEVGADANWAGPIQLVKLMTKSYFTFCNWNKIGRGRWPPPFFFHFQTQYDLFLKKSLKKKIKSISSQTHVVTWACAWDLYWPWQDISVTEMFHFLKNFLSSKWQVNREHIHNKINMQSIKHFKNIIIHKKPVSQPWDRCVPLMSCCVQHPISQNAELLMVNWHR